MVAEDSGNVFIPKGPRADDSDFAFRAVHPDHWIDGRPSSATFKIDRPFSVFLQSLLSDDLDEAGGLCVRLLEAGELGEINQRSAFVGFNCGQAVERSFHTHIERETHEHESHANVYAISPEGSPLSGSGVKKRAKDLAKLAAQHIVREPVMG